MYSSRSRTCEQTMRPSFQSEVKARLRPPSSSCATNRHSLPLMRQYWIQCQPTSTWSTGVLPRPPAPSVAPRQNGRPSRPRRSRGPASRAARHDHQLGAELRMELSDLVERLDQRLVPLLLDLRVRERLEEDAADVLDGEAGGCDVCRQRFAGVDAAVAD